MANPVLSSVWSTLAQNFVGEVGGGLWSWPILHDPDRNTAHDLNAMQACLIFDCVRGGRQKMADGIFASVNGACAGLSAELFLESLTSEKDRAALEVSLAGIRSAIVASVADVLIIVTSEPTAVDDRPDGWSSAAEVTRDGKWGALRAGAVAGQAVGTESVTVPGVITKEWLFKLSNWMLSIPARKVKTLSTLHRTLAEFLCAIGKRGNPTDRWVQSRVTAIRTDLKDQNFVMDRAVIQDIWNTYLSTAKFTIAYFDALNTRLLAVEFGIRLRITIIQVDWQGMTVFQTVQGVLESLPPDSWMWSAIALCIPPSEFRTYKLAKAQIANDPKSAYTQADHAEKFKGTGFPNLARFAILYKQRVDLDRQIADYRGTGCQPTGAETEIQNIISRRERERQQVGKELIDNLTSGDEAAQARMDLAL